MTTHADIVTIERRFACSARIDRDLAGTPPEVSGLFDDVFPERVGRWNVVAVTGSRTGLREAIATAAGVARLERREHRRRTLLRHGPHRRDHGAEGPRKKSGGMLIILDELGKMLESVS